eukprot:s392_g24.t1
MASSISTCSGALNVPASCVANIAVFNGALSVLMQSTLAGDAVCNKKWVNKQIARFENQQNRVKIEATQFLKCQGSSTTFRHWKQSGLQAGILLGDSTIHCYPDKQRVCAVDIMGLFAVLSLAPPRMLWQSAVAG